MVTEKQLRDDVYLILHKETLDDDILDEKRDDAELGELDLGRWSFLAIAGFLSERSRSHGGVAVFPSEIRQCKTVGLLVARYRAAVVARGAQ